MFTIDALKKIADEIRLSSCPETQKDYEINNLQAMVFEQDSRTLNFVSSTRFDRWFRAMLLCDKLLSHYRKNSIDVYINRR